MLLFAGRDITSLAVPTPGPASSPLTAPTLFFGGLVRSHVAFPVSKPFVGPSEGGTQGSNAGLHSSPDSSPCIGTMSFEPTTNMNRGSYGLWGSLGLMVLVISSQGHYLSKYSGCQK